MGDFKYEIQEDFDHIIDERGNAFIALRKIKWGDSDEAKLDIRKWYNAADGERMSKGVSFLTEEGPSELAKVLVENGYGDTEDIISGIKNREDFMSSLVKQLDGNEEVIKKYSSDEYYDPKEVLVDE